MSNWVCCQPGTELRLSTQQQGEAMNAYDLEQATSSQGIDQTTIDRAIASWGVDTDYGWTGGCLLKLTDGRFAYVTAACSEAGGDRQSSAKYFAAQPALKQLSPLGWITE